MIFFIKEDLFGHLYEIEIILRHHVKLPKLIPDTISLGTISEILEIS